MICHACQERRHEECRGGSWCACQHRGGPATPHQREAEDEAGPDAASGAEPPVNWVRQG
ncbi:hypothetical protein [Thermomonospora echinospora]|uniref:hypothetical protein n=1 Tax=Thermomonospora echinospora TaxID=1992 RepID=UPI00135A2225|nr:hypothetical protein [Thermomonospora echinospora]